MSTQGTIFLSHGVGLRHARQGATATPLTVGKLLRALGLLLLLWPVSAQAAILFDTDFEDCTTNGTSADFTCGPGWRYLDGGTSTNLGIVTGHAFTGTKSLRLTYVTLDNTHSITPTPSLYQPSPFTPQTHIFLRFAHQLAAGFQCSPNNTKLIRVQEGTLYPRVWLSCRNGTYAIVVEGSFDDGNFTAFDTGITPPRGQWSQVEFEWLLNTPGQSNGLMRMWIDGTLRAEALNRAWIGAGANASGLVSSAAYTIKSVQVYLQNGVGTMYYDRIAVGTTRIGPVIGGPPLPQADTTPPSPPTCAQIGTPCP